MSKIYFDETSFNRLLNERLERTVSLLNEARYVAASLNIPYNFNYRSYLQKLDDNIKQDMNTINTVYNKIKGDAKKYGLINDEVNSSISGIENYSISLRQSAIK